MAVIRNLDILLQLRDQEFSQKLDKSAAKTSQFNQQIQTLGGQGRLSNGLGRIAGGFGNVTSVLGTAGVAGFAAAAGFSAIDRTFDALLSTGAAAVSLFQSVSTELVEMGKVAQRLDLTAAEGQILQLAGASIGRDLEDVADLVNEINLKIGEASLEGGDLADAFARLGLDPRDLAALDNSLVRAQVVIDAVEALGSTTERAAVADQIFGGDAARVASELAGRIDAAAAAVNRFGLGIDDLGLEQIQQIQRDFADVRIQAELFAQRLVVEAAPAVIQIAENFEGIAADVGNIGDRIETTGNRLEAMVLVTERWADSLGNAAAGADRLLNISGAINTGFENSPLGQIFGQVAGDVSQEERGIIIGERAQRAARQAAPAEREETTLAVLPSETADVIANRVGESVRAGLESSGLTSAIREQINVAAIERGGREDFSSRFAEFATVQREPLERIADIQERGNRLLSDILEESKAGSEIRVTEHSFN